MSNNVFSTRMRRLASASVFVVVAALCLGAWVLFWDPIGSSAAPPTNNADGADVSAATANLEVLHQRTAARNKADDDDQHPSWGHAITPEQAASLAQQVARARGDATTQHNSIELQTRNGRPVYAVRLAGGSVHVDADTGVVVP